MLVLQGQDQDTWDLCQVVVPAQNFHVVFCIREVQDEHPVERKPIGFSVLGDEPEGTDRTPG